MKDCTELETLFWDHSLGWAAQLHPAKSLGGMSEDATSMENQSGTSSKN